MTGPRDPETALTGADLLAWHDFRRELRAGNKSPATVTTYGDSLAQLAIYLADNDLGTVLGAGKRELSDFIVHLLDTRSAGTALNRYSGLTAAYAYFEREDMITVSPMRKVPKPKGQRALPRVLDDAQLRALLAACTAPAGVTDAAKAAAARDRAIIGLWCEAGSPRLAEMAGLTLDDIDLRADQVLVHGKGRKDRLVPMSPDTGRDMSRWLRLRLPLAARRRGEAAGAAWLGDRGPLTVRGLAEMLDKRAGLGGIGHVHPHELRHTAYHRFRLAGGSLDDAMRLFGWSDISMALVYGRAAAVARSVQVGRDMALRQGL